MDDRVRALERQAKAGDEQALERVLEIQRALGDQALLARVMAGQCALGRHDWRLDRRCARCRAQRPGTSCEQALRAAADGRGAFGWAWGQILATAHGTAKGFPRSSRKQRGLHLEFYPAVSRRGPGGAAVPVTEPTLDQWDPPYGPVEWDALDKRHANRRGAGSARRQPETPRQMIRKLQWEPFCQTCWHNHHLRWDRDDAYAPCPSCQLPLTAAQELVNARGAARRAADHLFRVPRHEVERRLGAPLKTTKDETTGGLVCHYEYVEYHFDLEDRVAWHHYVPAPEDR